MSCFSFNSCEEGINWYAKKFGYDVEKVLNTDGYFDTTFYGSWDDIKEFIEEREDNKEYFWEVVYACKNDMDCESTVDFWKNLSPCLSSIVIDGNPWTEEDEYVNEDEE